MVGSPGSSRLRDLGPDAEVTVARQHGSAAVFRVMRVEEYPEDEFPGCGLRRPQPRRTAVDQLLRRQHRPSPTSSRLAPHHPHVQLAAAQGLDP
jgi:hypothetical protein